MYIKSDKVTTRTAEQVHSYPIYEGRQNRGIPVFTFMFNGPSMDAWF